MLMVVDMELAFSPSPKKIHLHKFGKLSFGEKFPLIWQILEARTISKVRFFIYLFIFYSKTFSKTTKAM